MKNQVEDFLQSFSTEECQREYRDAHVFTWIGANDVFGAHSKFLDYGRNEVSMAQKEVDLSIAVLMNTWKKLREHCKIKKIFALSYLDLSTLPRHQEKELEALKSLSALGSYFNQMSKKAAEKVNRETGLKFDFFDLTDAVKNVRSYFKNTDGRCIRKSRFVLIELFFGANTSLITVDCEPEGEDVYSLQNRDQLFNQFMWFDGVHPTEAFHKALADQFLKQFFGKGK